MKHSDARSLAIWSHWPLPAMAQPYTDALARATAVKLADARSQTEVWILPSVGNIAYRMTVKGHDVLRWPHASLDAFKASPNATGIPFMGPWINRLDEQAFYANGTRYAFDMALGNVRGAIPIHGFITTTDHWQRRRRAAPTATSAWVTSRLEFYRQPAWMKQWPFAHTIDMTYRLREGVLEVATAIANLSAEPMPVSSASIRTSSSPTRARDDWTISVGARTHWKLPPNKVPTGETEPIERVLSRSVGGARCATSTSTTTSAISCATRAAAPR